jgi:hypothetical protein
MHINVEMCNTAMALKYLFKYITRGPDHTMAKVQQEDEVHKENEIEDYEDLGCIGASKSCWRIFTFETNEVHPSVQALPIHFENGQRAQFEEGKEVLAVQEGAPNMQLMMWFHYNQTRDPSEVCVLYPNFPKEYVLNRSSKVWTKQKRKEPFPTIGHVYNVHPTMGKLYYLRLHQRL